MVFILSFDQELFIGYLALSVSQCDYKITKNEIILNQKIR